jgi:hypothetical protein
MQQQELLKKIGEIIKELNDQYKQLGTGNQKLNDFELEFFVANTQYLAQNTELLRKLNAHLPSPVAEQAAPEKKEKYFEPLVHQPEPEEIPAAADDADKIAATKNSVADSPAANIDIASDTPSDSYSFLREEPEIIRHELEIDESWLEDEDEQAGELVEEAPTHEEVKVTEPLVEPVVEKVEVDKPVSEKPFAKKADEEVLTINQKISAQMAAKTVSEVPPITDLKSAIILNDKLLYVKELFNGYSLAYSEAIEILNRLTSFDEARHFLSSNYVTKNNWAEKPATTEKFYSVLRRRYSQ